VRLRILGRIPHLDKVLHATEFGILAVLLCRAASSRTRGGRPAPGMPGRVRLAAAIAMAYALTDEIHQAFVPPRSPDVLDLGADWLGILVAVGLWRRLGRRWPWLNG